MSYSAKNYTAHGGNETVIDGKLTFLPGAQVEGLTDLLDIPEKAVPLIAHQPDSTATTVAALKDDLNALLAKLKAAGIMAADTPGE